MNIRQCWYWYSYAKAARRGCYSEPIVKAQFSVKPIVKLP